jgi:hypothetical protein
VEWCSDEGRLVLRWTGRRSTHGRAWPHVDGASPRVVEEGPGRVALSLAAAGGRRTATAAAATTATATAGGRRSARRTEGGGGLVKAEADPEVASASSISSSSWRSFCALQKDGNGLVRFRTVFKLSSFLFNPRRRFRTRVLSLMYASRLWRLSYMVFI